MNTKLKVRSNILASDEKSNERLREFVEHCLGYVDLKVEYVNNDRFVDSVTPVFYTEYNNHYELKKALNSINSHRYTPHQDFKDISPLEYNISLESDNINESFGHLSDQNIQYLEDQINILSYTIGMEIDEQKQIKSRLDSMHAFMDKSGLFYYKGMMEHLLDKLDEHGIIKKDDLNPSIFKQVH